MKIGVISDTHNCFDWKIPELFAGVDHILHAGDIGSDFVIVELEAIAPVTAVSGNDTALPNLQLTQVAVLAGRKFLVQHVVNPHALNENLRQFIAREQPDVVVFGHTHRRFCGTIDGVLYLNPGYAGKPKFGAERTVAILRCQEMRVEFLPL